MEDMSNMRDSMKMHSFCPMTSCPMMNMQPMNINPITVQAPNCMNYNTHFNEPVAYQYRYNAAPIESNLMDPYLFQINIKPVSIKEIED